MNHTYAASSNPENMQQVSLDQCHPTSTALCCAQRQSMQLVHAWPAPACLLVKPILVSKPIGLLASEGHCMFRWISAIHYQHLSDMQSVFTHA